MLSLGKWKFAGNLLAWTEIQFSRVFLGLMLVGIVSPGTGPDNLGNQLQSSSRSLLALQWATKSEVLPDACRRMVSIRPGFFKNLTFHISNLLKLWLSGREFPWHWSPCDSFWIMRQKMATV